MWPLWHNAPRHVNHKTDSDIPLPTSFLGSGSVHSKKVTLTFAGTLYANVLLLEAHRKLSWLSTSLNWYFWYFPTTPSPSPWVVVSSFKYPLPSYSGCHSPLPLCGVWLWAPERSWNKKSSCSLHQGCFLWVIWGVASPESECGGVLTLWVFHYLCWVVG